MEHNKKPSPDQNKEEQYLTTNQGVRINHTDDSLKAGDRGPTLLEDFHFREKMMHFDHERIPERVVHPRGSGAHGYFQVYEPMTAYTKAGFLQDPGKKTPVFVRFSTVVGFRGSPDTVRDVRGFAVKFYTEDGNYDLVGNNMPVFFIQDAIKFPDLVHSIKPEPHHEMPQASAAHDNFWDFISLMPESMHMIMWVLSDRALPRSLAMMEGFGVHTFRFVNDEGKSRFVKFHWKPVAGMHSLVWDESQKIAGKDPDFNRRDLWESIEVGNYPEFELGVQMIEEEQADDFAFDILDATKLWPEELVPVRIIGKMTLDRNPDNFFAETEQVAFHPGHVVSGIDVTNDPLLQGRLFSYLDTQLIRLGGPNFAEIPINRPHAEVNNNQRDGYMRQTINKGRVNYFPNSLADGHPKMAPEEENGYVHYPEHVQGPKIRTRGEGFRDHFSQATLFYNSMSAVEKKHILEAFLFELGKVETMDIQERMVRLIAHVDADLSRQVAEGLGLDPLPDHDIQQIQEDLRAQRERIWQNRKTVERSPALSMENTKKDSIKGRKIAILAAEGADVEQIVSLKNALKAEGAKGEVVSTRLGKLKNLDEVKIDKTFTTTASVLYDAVYVAGGEDSVEKLRMQGDAIHFINEAFKHCKPIGATAEGIKLLQTSSIRGVNLNTPDDSGGPFDDGSTSDNGVVKADSYSGDFFTAFKESIAQHRHWNRAKKDMVPA
ncbi:catalase [Nibrella saemangeumensis]|uniref:Catalase n=1 Tax=Nibrella saemangeumensis TaxID=1084526 RepID=A0ABP8NL11_9BACT